MPERLGRYLIECELGKGGMGVVYRALDERLGKKVAVKLLSRTPDSTSESIGRLRREARAAAILNHPSIVSVYDYDDAGGSPFIVYEYVEGRTLDLIIADGPLSESRIVDITGQIASALAYAHQRGIMHRDIKPQNIIVTEDGHAKILDFGLAKQMRLEFHSTQGSLIQDSSVATEAGTIVGTVQYMSPEQIGGEELDGRSDIFSLGIVLYEMATGKNPFLGQNFASTMSNIMSVDPAAWVQEPGASSAGLREIIRRCLQKRREDRYPSAHLLLDDLAKLRNPGLKETEPGVPGEHASPAEGLIPRAMARGSLLLLQIMYLIIYGIALYNFYDVCLKITRQVAPYLQTTRAFGMPLSALISSVFLLSVWCGMAVRLYLIASVGFDDRETGVNFGKLFPYLFVLDEVWALSPMLLIEKWPAGITLICVALLAYLPISHRNLVRSAYITSW